MSFEVGSVIARIKADITDFKAGINQAKQDAGQLTKSVSDTSTGFQNFQRNLNSSAIAMVAVGGAISGLTGLSIKNAAQMEQQATAFKVLTGSAEQGKKSLDELVSFAAKTPFQIPQILEQSKRLLAMGTTAENLIPTFTMLGDVASGVGMEKLPQLVLAFGQIQARGFLAGTELRQLTEAGFNLADALGMTNGQLMEMVENREITFDHVVKGFQNVTAEGGRFNGMMEQLAGTTAGKFSNLQDNIFKLTATIGQIFLPIINQIIEKILPLLQTFAEWAKENQTLVTIIVAVGVTLFALGTAILILTPIITGFIATISFVSSVITGAITIIGVIIGVLGGPLTIIIIAVIAILAALYAAWNSNFLGIRDITNAVITFIVNYFTSSFNNIMAIVKFAFETVKNVVQNGWNFIKGIFDSALSFISGWGGRVLSALVQPFEDAWNRISDIMRRIRDALDFTKRHSPSIVDIVNKGVYLVNRAMENLDFGGVLSPNINPTAVMGGGSSAQIANVTVSLEGAFIGDMSIASRIGEKIGDSIIRKLQANVRF